MPGFLLRDRITIQNYSGNTAYGASVGAPRVVKAKVEPTNRLIVGPGGNSLQARATALIRPEAGPVPVESKVTWGGKEYRVLAAGALPDEVNPTHRELVLG
jgi:hypothetical protein